MWIGRFWPIVAVLAIAGSLAAKKRMPVTEGTMPTHGPLFVALLIGTVVLVGVLTYVPALALGPVVEHFMLLAGHIRVPHVTATTIALRSQAHRTGAPRVRAASSTRACSGAIR